MLNTKAKQKGDFLYTTVHDFKTHLSAYMAALEAGTIRAVIVKRRNKESCIFFLKDRLQNT